jgi:hypothetical protein
VSSRAVCHIRRQKRKHKAACSRAIHTQWQGVDDTNCEQECKRTQRITVQRARGGCYAARPQHAAHGVHAHITNPTSTRHVCGSTDNCNHTNNRRHRAMYQESAANAEPNPQGSVSVTRQCTAARRAPCERSEDTRTYSMQHLQDFSGRAASNPSHNLAQIIHVLPANQPYANRRNHTSAESKQQFCFTAT